MVDEVAEEDEEMLDGEVELVAVAEELEVVEDEAVFFGPR